MLFSPSEKKSASMKIPLLRIFIETQICFTRYHSISGKETLLTRRLSRTHNRHCHAPSLSTAEIPSPPTQPLLRPSEKLLQGQFPFRFRLSRTLRQLSASSRPATIPLPCIYAIQFF